MNSNAVHREELVWPGWTQFAMILPLIGGVGGLIWAYSQDRLTTGIVIAAGVLVLVGLVFLRFRSIVIEFGPDGAAFGFNKPSRRVPCDRIVAAEVETYDVARYMGWGFRFGWEARDRAYSIMGHPRGIRLIFDDEKGRRWKVFVSIDDPETAMKALGLEDSSEDPG